MNTAMLSEARQTANAANACLSTGTRTAEGKARSSQNARKHGLTAAQLVIAAEVAALRSAIENYERPPTEIVSGT